MEAISADEFLRWAAGVGIGFDERYPGARCLGFLPPSDHSRFWTLPGDPATWPRFAGSVLDGLDKWSSGFLWPRSGRWPGKERASSRKKAVRAFVLRGAGIPENWNGAVHFRRDEEDVLLAVLFVYLTFGWRTDDDLYFIPDHARQIVQTDHHDVIHVECADEGRALEFVQSMSKAGYELPTEPPDETFRRPAWMIGE
jgi:hypothetical protein